MTDLSTTTLEAAPLTAGQKAAATRRARLAAAAGGKLPPTKAQAIEAIRQRLATDDVALYKGLEIIYSYQTRSEQETESTHEDNGVGFGAFDAEILSSFAQQLAKRGSLSFKQLVIARKKLPHYAKQLTVCPEWATWTAAVAA
jgi:hypothetical protein